MLNEQDRARFAAKFEAVPESGCWLWTAALVDGYGVFRLNDKQVKAHRVAWSLAGNPLPVWPDVLDHVCRTRSCCNPDHLRVLSVRDNILCGEGRAAKNLLVTKCPRGHAYTDENTRVFHGQRHCRSCVREKYHTYPGRKEAMGERMRRVRSERVAAGLTTRGTVRKYKLSSLTR